MPELTEEERKFLSFALDLAFEAMVNHSPGFTETDWSAHEKLKRIAEGKDA